MFLFYIQCVDTKITKFFRKNNEYKFYTIFSVVVLIFFIFQDVFSINSLVNPIFIICIIAFLLIVSIYLITVFLNLLTYFL